MDPLTLLGLAVFAAIPVAALAGGASLVAARYRLARARKHAIAEMPEAIVGVLVGRVRVLGEPVRSPLTNVACVAFTAELASDFEPGVYRETRATAFVLEDDSGAAVIEATDARLDLAPHITGPCGRSLVTTGEQDMFVRSGKPPTAMLHDWTFREAVIVPGQMLVVVGAGTRVPDASTQLAGGDVYRELPTRLVLAARRGYPLVVSDRVARWR